VLCRWWLDEEHWPVKIYCIYLCNVLFVHDVFNSDLVFNIIFPKELQIYNGKMRFYALDNLFFFLVVL